MNSSDGEDNWGLCMECQWWQVEPEAKITHSTLGFCIDEDLQPYKLSIPGNGGCNRFAQGAPARGSGSSQQPPAATPAR